MKKIFLLVIMLFSLFIISCSNENTSEVKNEVTIQELPCQVVAKTDSYGVISIESFEILKSTKGSSKTLVEYQITLSCDGNRLSMVGFYFGFYDEEDYRIGSSWFWEEYTAGEKMKLKEDFYMPNETKMIKFLPAD